MGFLDNSGDIILDAVLTDTGRFRLAKGDGTFAITKFALGDDEINYELFRNSNNSKGAHPSGSAYYDLEILQTPILEAFTNNTSFLKSKLVSIPRTDLLYLPITKLNETMKDTQRNERTAQANEKFIILSDETTSRLEDATSNPGLFTSGNGMMNGINPRVGSHIRLDQGLDTADIDPKIPLDRDLVETQYLLEIDDRLGTVVSTTGTPARKSFVDDDQIATYYVSLGSDGNFVSRISSTDTTSEATETIRGPRGTKLEFKLLATIELQRSDTLFEKMGTVSTTANFTRVNGDTAITNYIDTTIKVTGVTTGYRIDIPVRFLKINS